MSGDANQKKTWIDEVDFRNISCDERCDFVGFKDVKSLVDGGMAEIPKKIGVYLILAPRRGKMPLLSDGLKTAFENNDETPKEEDKLRKRWIEDTQVLYIGKAGVLNGKGTSNLYTRLRAYLKWYKKEKNSHHGGRDIWQLPNPGGLLVVWRVTPNEDPRSCEKKLLERFNITFHEDKKTSGKDKKKKCLPFANHQS